MFSQFNALYACLNEEISDIRDKNSSNEGFTSSLIYEDGSAVIPVRTRDWHQIGRARVEYNGRTHHGRMFEHHEYSGTPLVNDNQIMKNKGGKKLLGLYANMMSSDDHMGKFYGMTISYEEKKTNPDRVVQKKLNPLHPVIAAMITAGEIRLPDEFTIVVYPYQEKMDIDEGNAEEYKKEIIEGITLIREEQHLPSVTYRANGSEESDIQSFTNNPDYSISFSESGENTECAVIPVQLATSGVTYPYYGLIMSDRTSRDKYRSTNLYPCLSGNIDVSTARGGQTCVGELSNAVFASLYVLSNMNINSLYFTEVYTSETLTFVHACQSVSAAFLSAWAGIVPEPIEEEAEEEAEEEIVEDEIEEEAFEVESAYESDLAEEIYGPVVGPDDQVATNVRDTITISDVGAVTEHTIESVDEHAFDTTESEDDGTEEVVEDIDVVNDTPVHETEITVDLATTADHTGIAHVNGPIA